MKASLIAALAASVLGYGAVGASAQQPGALKLVKTVTLPGYTGDFDHFAVDRVRNRFLLAAEDHATLEVFDLKTGAHLRTITGFGAPHSILVRPSSSIILVTDSDKMTHALNADTYAETGSVTLTPGADSAGYDAAANVYYIVTGGKDVKMATALLEAINPDTGQRLGSIEFKDNHVEAMALEKNGPRIFINLAQTNQLAVVDRKAMKVIALWPIPPAKQNAMVAFDEAAHRLYVVCRDPGMVVVLNSDTGVVVSTAPAPLRADEVVFNSAAHRLYVPGGEGYIGIYDTADANHVKQIAKVISAAGAKTAILLPDLKQMLVAVSPGESKAMAKVLTYSVE